MDPKRIEAIAAARLAGTDAGRLDAITRVHATGHLSARERIAALLDPGSAVEFGSLRGRVNEQWLPTLGGVDFLGTIDGHAVVASSTDYSHHGGGYGAGNLARLFALAQQERWPVVLFVDGGGSQAQTLDGPGTPVEGLHGRYEGTIGFFEALLELGGLVPSVAVVSGPSFAGHASLAASCDCIIATPGSSIGMGGPPMVEAAFGLRLRPTELGPVEMHETSGGVDLLLDDEPAAIHAVRRYLSYYYDPTAGAASTPSAELRAIVPDEGPYEMRRVIEGLVDCGSFFELRPAFAVALITGFARIDGRAVGVIANQPLSPGGGAIDQAAANKLARFVQLCDAYALPVLSLIDTPGCVVRSTDANGEESFSPGTTRHHARPLRAQHHRSVPLFCVQIGKARGLAAAAMTGSGRTHALPLLRLGWPTAELNGRDPYWPGLDDVIDPNETRAHLICALRLVRRPPPAERPRRVRDVW